MKQSSILCLDVKGFDLYIEDLANLLRDCVHDGASVGFVQPFSLENSRGFWVGKIRPSLVSGETTLMIATVAGEVAGTVQLCTGSMPNQTHKGEVSKLLVSPKFRKRGTAKMLMAELEKQARDRYFTLITLDTRTGDNAEPLYKLLGYETAGVIPGYAQDPHDTGKFDPTTYMYKQL
ncbi:GNAT family N-acetyltransferase [Kiloniella antarctica]|uniref:GNAT family N-acetyltransferase n=1 Tax=Kiloniella antarctica TaxID=1550907 RepID=A0ABW5BM64_9PROT